MEPGINRGNEVVYIPSHVVFHDTHESTPGVSQYNIHCTLYTITLYIHVHTYNVHVHMYMYSTCTCTVHVHMYMYI